MKKIQYLAAILVFAVGLVAGSVQASGDQDKHDEHGEEQPGMVTVHGEILDMACYVAHAAKGADHASCAKRCVKGGQPMGLLAKDGTVYLLFASHSDPTAFNAAKEFAGKDVEITGPSSKHGGIAGIEVQSVKAM